MKAARAGPHVRRKSRECLSRCSTLANCTIRNKITYATGESVDSRQVKDRTKIPPVLAPLREVDALAHLLRVFDDTLARRRGRSIRAGCRSA